MASATRITVSTTAVRLDQNTADNTQGHSVVIKNTAAVAAGADTINVGGPGITAGTGYALGPGEKLELSLTDPETIYGIRAGSADVVVHVLNIS